VDDFVEIPLLEEEHIIGYQGDSRRILIVDDRSENRAVLSNMLQPLGFETQEAINGLDCLDKVKAFHPHLILMDLRMPGLNGLETMRRLRQTPQENDLIMIAVSASAFDHDEAASREAGAADFLSKPFRFQRLLHLLEQHLRLDWVIAEPVPSAPPVDAQVLVVPPQDRLAQLFDLARRGDVQEIVDQCETLAREGYEVFATRLSAMAQDFKLKEIRHLIEQYRSQPNESQ
jgi:CheY-like chemotaxis protein